MVNAARRVCRSAPREYCLATRTREKAARALGPRLKGSQALSRCLRNPHAPEARKLKNSALFLVPYRR